MAQKRTKRERFMDLREIVVNLLADDPRQDQFLDLIDGQINDLNKRKDAQRQRYNRKRQENTYKSDIYDDIVLANVDDDYYMTIPEIIQSIDSSDLTKGRIIKSLNNMAKAGVLEKKIRKIQGKKKTVFKVYHEPEPEIDERSLKEETQDERKQPVYTQDALYLDDSEEIWWEE